MAWEERGAREGAGGAGAVGPNAPPLVSGDGEFLTTTPSIMAWLRLALPRSAPPVCPSGLLLRGAPPAPRTPGALPLIRCALRGRCAPLCLCVGSTSVIVTAPPPLLRDNVHIDAFITHQSEPP